MKKIEWDERLSVGIREIDDQHKHLLSLCRKVIRTFKSGATQTELRGVVAQLREYVNDHFQHESQVMARFKYPKLNEHVSEHVRLTAAVKALHFSGHKGQDIDLATLRGLLKSWIVDHIIRYDLGYAKHIKELAQADAKRAAQATVPQEATADGAGEASPQAATASGAEEAAPKIEG